MTEDRLSIGKRTFRSRLFAGTCKWSSLDVMTRALAASGTEVVTVAVRRVDLNDRSSGSVRAALEQGGYTILPNTAGCTTADDAVRTARLADEWEERGEGNGRV